MRCATCRSNRRRLVQGAVVAIDNRTGQIRAMVGGFSFARSKFNRATQANRQVGSLFKPIVFTAAIDHGYTATSVFEDEPVAYAAGPGQPDYSPLNYDRKFEGPVTLRRALEQSRNIPAVKAMAEIGPAEVVSYAKRFGLRGRYDPYLSMALGAGEATLLEMTSAYSLFPNQGVRMEPYSVMSIADREGNLLEENRPQPREAIRADTAFIMTNVMRGVVDRGTASGRGIAQVAARRENRNDGRIHRRVVHRVRPDRSRSAYGWAMTRRSRWAPEKRAPARLCRSGLM